MKLEITKTTLKQLAQEFKKHPQSKDDLFVHLRNKGWTGSWSTVNQNINLEGRLPNGMTLLLTEMYQEAFKFVDKWKKEEAKLKALEIMEAELMVKEGKG